MDGFAFGRDNGQLNPPVVTEACLGGQCTDRSLGLYDVEITADGVNWVSVGTIERDWRFIMAWLRVQLSDPTSGTSHE